MSRVLKSTLLIINLILMAACQGAETAGTPVEIPQTVLPSPSATITLPPQPSLTPSPLPPTALPSPRVALTSTLLPNDTPSPIPLTPYPEEWLSFTVRDFRQWAPTIYDLVHAHTAIYFVKSDGSELLQPELVDPNEITIQRSLTWSPDGYYLLFDGRSIAKYRQVPTDEGRELPMLFHLYLSDLTAGKLLKIEGEFDGTLYGNPSWAPDGRRFANTTDARITTTEGKTLFLPNLVITNAGDRRRWRLTTSPSSDLYPSWSPDGQWIAFIHYPRAESPCNPYFPSNYGNCNKADLYLIRSNGNEPRILLESVFIQSDRVQRDSAYNAPAWAPDSRWLAVLVGEQQPDIALVNVESGETHTLAAHEAQDLYPTWSPDGGRLAFVSNRGGDEDIYLVSIDGKELVNLTHNPASDFNPVWSPSGRFIAFLSDREEPGAYKLYVMNADGNDQKKLYDGYVFTRPAWFPRLDVDLRDFIKFGSN